MAAPDPVTGAFRAITRGRRRRRHWVGNGRAHIEVRGLDLVAAAALRRDVQESLVSMPGVAWAEPNPLIGRVVVAMDEDQLDVAALIGCVEAVERRHGVEGVRFPLDRPDHPGDDAPIFQHAVALGADLAGLALSGIGRFSGMARLPHPAAAVLAFVQNEPRVRAALASQIGHVPADIGLAAAGALSSGLSGGPFSLLVSAAYRSVLLREAHAVRSTWTRREPALHDAPANSPILPVDPVPRPVPVSDGPAAAYARRAGPIGAMAAGSILLATGDLSRAGATLLSSVPRPARYGIETFAAWLGTMAAERDIVCLDRTALRRLDAVDTVCIDTKLLLTGRRVIDRVLSAPGAPAEDVHRRLAELFDPADPDGQRHLSGWTLGPIGGLPTHRAPRQIRAARDELPADSTLGLVRDGVLVALITTVEELVPGAHTLLAVAHHGDHMLALAGGSLELVERLGGDLLVDGGDQLADSVRMMQGDGCSVLLVAGDDAGAHRAADVGLGVHRPGEPVPWGADLLCGDDLDDVRFLAEAAVVAHEVSRQSAAISLGTSAISGLFVFTRPPWRVAGNASTTVGLGTLLAGLNAVRAAEGVARRAPREIEAATPWHELEVDEVLAALGSGVGGLGGDEVRARLTQRVDAGTGPATPLALFLDELRNPLTPVLGAGATLSAAVGSVADAALVTAVVALNAAVGAAQRLQVEHAVAEMARRESAHVRVRRQGMTEIVRASELVPGDIVLLAAGDAVPADARIVEATSLEVDESSLTGESLPVPKLPAPSYARAVAERTSMLYDGTTIAAGEAVAVVVAVGGETEAGTAARQSGDPVPNGVDARLDELTRITMPFALGGGAVVALSGLLRGQPLRTNIESGVSLAVAAVPEGLPLLTTMAQLAASRRLASRGALVRNPRAVEALGRVDVLCVDKTGTLTEGRIRLGSVLDCDGEVHDVEGSAEPVWRSVVAAALRASPTTADDHPLPHPTDQAIVDGAKDHAISADLGARGWQRRVELPFEPARGYHAVLGRLPDGASLLSLKGAPEVVLPRCDRIVGTAGEIALDAPARRRLDAAIEDFARRGQRVLAVAQREASGRRDLDDDRVQRLLLLGFVGLRDPSRVEARSAVERMQQAGIAVVMVTGDHPSTARGIATELGIVDHEGTMMTGAELDALDDDALTAAVEDVAVFARVTPAHKVRIVAAYQRRGRAVAMTGDGANDAPAIRLADAGIALGERATTAARTAADVVVPDGRIETLIDAIVEGRAMWVSVRDALAILLGGNLGEITYTVTGSLLNGRAPLNARQLLLVNLLTDVAPALAIAVRPPGDVSPDQLLREGPEASLGGALDQAIVARAIATASGAAGAFVAGRLTGRHQRASTIGLVALVGTQLGQTLVTGGRHPTVVAASLGSMAALAMVVQTPGLSQFFGCTPLTPIGWAIGGTAAAGATAASTLAGPLLRLALPAPAPMPGTERQPAAAR